MWPFKKKKVNNECVHKYKDFPWYIEGRIQKNPNNRKIVDYTIQIIEPYVCTKCHKRKNVVLYESSGFQSTEKQYFETIDALYNLYKDNLSNKPDVEDMINDMILVDRDYIDMYDKIVKS